MMNLDMTKLEPLLGTIINEMGAAVNASLVLTGERLGLWRALAEGGPLSSQELAVATRTRERYVREWLASQTSSGFVTYDADTDRYFLTPAEQRTVLQQWLRTATPRTRRVAQELARQAADG